MEWGTTSCLSRGAQRTKKPVSVKFGALRSPNGGLALTRPGAVKTFAAYSQHLNVEAIDVSADESIRYSD
jgi:hypothetical protein